MTRPGYRLTAEAEDDRLNFVSEYGYEGNCSCHLSPPCGSCLHQGILTSKRKTTPHGSRTATNVWSIRNDYQ